MPSLRTVDEELVAAAAVETPDVADAPPGPRIARPFPQETPPGIVHWQATGFSVSTHTEKSVVFAPLAIANHVAPAQGDWVAQLRCPACDEPPADYTPPEGEEEDEGGGWHADADLVLDDLGALEEHLAWQHTALADSLNELRTLKTNFQFHTTNFRDWARQGGPINPIWARDTLDLRRQLHRAQCRAARRIFATKQEASSSRCLGAFLVYRKQRAWTLRDRKKAAEASRTAAGATTPGQEPQQPPTPRTPTQPHRHRRQGSTLVPNDDRIADSAADDSFEDHRRHLEELAACNAVGNFERFGDRDIAFVCDFCDGHIVWEDLEGMPSLRTVDEELVAAAAVETPDVADAPPGPRIARPFPQETPPGIVHWQATGFSVSTHTEKSVVFAPLAIANHVAPAQGDWVAQLRCPACDEPPADYTPPEGEEEDEGGGWHADADLWPAVEEVSILDT
ncbi:hypothetical protein BN1723_001292 [Verticillium longisporum]|uniref:Uncharacterized protein n=1 Tax=Verticillium longisporum TaxID=100787 RepID=A0A0G4NKL2_VERLO|nr:hypothetical protein BN1723_001292 [Verticillium longisporum]